MIGFHLLFPSEAANECRTVIPTGRFDLPHRTFVWMEAYCADPQCDCRRVMLNIVDAETHDHVATINYAFEPPEPPFDDEGQMFLDPLNPQSAMSPAFLEVTAEMLARDRGYHDRLVRHYTMWKTVVDDPSHPDQARLFAVRGEPDIPPRPWRRPAPKTGPNDPCPCGSGRKYKKCCRA
jgi:hypothetical protein